MTTTSAVKLFDPVYLTGGGATNSLYLSPANTKTLIKKLTVTNTDTVVNQVNIYLLKSGATLSNAYVIAYLQNIPIASVFECFEAEGQMLNPGDQIVITTTAATNTVVNAQGAGLTIV